MGLEKKSFEAQTPTGLGLQSGGPRRVPRRSCVGDGRQCALRVRWVLAPCSLPASPSDCPDHAQRGSTA
eukprot:2824833-Rhodomonas_salina.1